MPSEIATYNGRSIPLYRAWTDDNGDQHPRNWRSAWSDAEIAAKGITITPVPPKPDNRFYKSNGDPKDLADVPQVDEFGDPALDELGNQVVVKGVKTLAIEKVKAQANDLLKDTDWMVIRASEDNLVPARVVKRAVPNTVLVYRDAVRTKASDMEAAINACATIDDFKALHEPPVDGNGDPVGNAPLSDWPVPPVV